ncbi:MAG: fibronectin type III domain-containing protein [Treponema sp.]|uniref:fibronectin type III domain-containing protein n=1 Tax=Treponema sp. TaxID=166 RepID=UPI003FA1E73B
MAGKKIAAVIGCLLLCAVFSLYAQNETDKHYFIREGEEGMVLYQRLSWQAFEDILGYEFELEQKNQSDEWITLDKQTVENNFIDVSLPPGSYRFRVSLINLLEQTEALSDYRNFDVLVAYQPEVYGLSPHLIYFDNIFSNRLIVEGKNFLRETVFTLEKPLSQPLVLIPVEIDKGGKRVVFELNMNRLVPGEYVFCARDKSGLYDKNQILELRFQKPVDIHLSAGYAFTGFTGKSVFTEYYERNFSAIGGILRFTVLPAKRSYGNFGFNLSCSASLLDKKSEYYTISGYTIMPQINAAYVYPIIKHRLNLDIHAGTGALFLVNSRFSFADTDFKSPATWYWGMSVNGGTALQFYIWRKLYLELNVDHIVTFKKGFPLYMYQPQLSVGWQF